MKNIAETEEYKGRTIEICYDESAENPFTEWDGLGKIVFHPRARYECNTDISYEDAMELPNSVALSAYIHSGIALSVLGEGYRCRFDTSDYIAVFVPDPEDERDPAESARSACELFNKWASGEVYGYRIDSPHAGEDDSCYGYYDIQDAITEAKSLIDYYEKEHKLGKKMFHATA